MKRKTPKLGFCPICKKPVSNRCNKTIMGREPQYVYAEGKVFHKHCWNEYKKSKRYIVNIGYRTPTTPFGSINLSREER